MSSIEAVTCTISVTPRRSQGPHERTGTHGLSGGVHCHAKTFACHATEELRGATDEKTLCCDALRSMFVRAVHPEFWSHRNVCFFFYCLLLCTFLNPKLIVKECPCPRKRLAMHIPKHDHPYMCRVIWYDYY